MKKNSFFSVLTSMILFASASVFFSSCQNEDTIGVSAPITVRTSAPDVPEILEVGEGFTVSFHAYAEGVQIYVCKETAPGVYQWVFKAPSAILYANADMTAVVGTHYAGPFWESNSGSKVKAAKLQGVNVDPTAVDWLLLGTVLTEGPGIFEGTTHIQRVNTVGGIAPADGANADTVGDEVEVPYTAEYYFYKAE